jgi:apolipoprotein N-acyltransferase
VGITAVSTLLVTLGALVTGVAILSLCSDIRFLATAPGFCFEAIMLGLVFSGMSFAGFGIGLYEGYPWARSASLSALAFVATVQVFGLASAGLVRNAVSFQTGLLALMATSVLYLTLPSAKRYFRPVRQTQNPSTVDQAQTVGALQQAS